VRLPKTAALTLVVLLLGSAVALAQGEDGAKLAQIAKVPPAERATAQTMVMQEKLALTPQQGPAVAAINLETANQMQPVLTASEGPLIRMRKAKAIEAQRDASLQKVLLPPQYQQWLGEKEAMRQKVEAKLMQKRQGGGN
jgi:hypothetical protein